MDEAKQDEGWGVIRPGDRKAHYYRDTMSLCRRIGLYCGSLEPGRQAEPGRLCGCRKELTRESVQDAKAKADA